MPPVPPQILQVLLLQLQVAENEHEVALLALIRERERLQNAVRRRRFWVRPWIARRRIFGQYYTLFQELHRESREDYFGYIRMEHELFAEILLRVTPRITKGLRSRRPLEPGLKLAITLRFLATGQSYRFLAYDFRVAHNTISQFVPEVCTAIYEEYKEEMFTIPSTPNEWKAVARQFGTRWNFHHCCSAAPFCWASLALSAALSAAAAAAPFFWVFFFTVFMTLGDEMISTCVSKLLEMKWFFRDRDSSHGHGHLFPRSLVLLQK